MSSYYIEFEPRRVEKGHPITSLISDFPVKVIEYKEDKDNTSNSGELSNSQKCASIISEKPMYLPSPSSRRINLEYDTSS